MKIKAAVVEQKNAPFVIQELELDDPRPDEIVVRIIATGVCQTDMHVQHQNIPVPLPMVLGHEGAGVVERVGQSVRSVKPGDHVVLTYAACGYCRRCVAGDGAYCEQTFPVNFQGSRLDGSIGIHRPKGA